jgi:hypothetical protein
MATALPEAGGLLAVPEGVAIAVTWYLTSLSALKDALCIRRAAIDAVLQIQLSEIEQHDNWLAILANEAKQKRLLLVQPRI